MKLIKGESGALMSGKARIKRGYRAGKRGIKERESAGMSGKYTGKLSRGFPRDRFPGGRGRRQGGQGAGKREGKRGATPNAKQGHPK